MPWWVRFRSCYTGWMRTTDFLAHQEKLSEQVPYFSEKHQQERERVISANQLLTWAEFQMVGTKAHPDPLPDWNFSQTFPDFPFIYRRAVIKDIVGQAGSLCRLRAFHFRVTMES